MNQIPAWIGVGYANPWDGPHIHTQIDSRLYSASSYPRIYSKGFHDELFSPNELSTLLRLEIPETRYEMPDSTLHQTRAAFMTNPDPKSANLIHAPSYPCTDALDNQRPSCHVTSWQSPSCHKQALCAYPTIPASHSSVGVLSVQRSPYSGDRFLNPAAFRGTPRRDDPDSLQTPANLGPRGPLAEVVLTSDVGGFGTCCP